MAESLQAHLMKIAGIGKDGAGGDRQDFLARLYTALAAKTAQNVDPDGKTWDSLGDDGQDWFNSAANVDNANLDRKDDEAQPYPEIPGNPPQHETQTKSAKNGTGSKADDADNREESNVKKRKPAKAAKANGKMKSAKPAAKKSAAVKAAKKGTEGKAAKKTARKPITGPTNVTLIKQIIIKAPWLRPAEVHEQLTKRGREATFFSVQAHMTDFKHSIKTLIEAGAIKGDFKFFERAEAHKAKQADK